MLNPSKIYSLQILPFFGSPTFSHGNVQRFIDGIGDFHQQQIDRGRIIVTLDGFRDKLPLEVFFQFDINVWKDAVDVQQSFLTGRRRSVNANERHLLYRSLVTKGRMRRIDSRQGCVEVMVCVDNSHGKKRRGRRRSRRRA